MLERPRGITTSFVLVLVIGIATVAGLGHLAADAQGGGTIGYGSKVLGRVSPEIPEVI